MNVNDTLSGWEIYAAEVVSSTSVGPTSINGEKSHFGGVGPKKTFFYEIHDHCGNSRRISGVSGALTSTQIEAETHQ